MFKTFLHFHKNFERQYQKLNKKHQKKVRQCLDLFLENPFHPSLNNHPLKGKYLDYRSIGITGDLRAIYKLIGENECIFAVLGTHNELYS